MIGIDYGDYPLGVSFTRGGVDVPPRGHGGFEGGRVGESGWK
jgi:hypothetical protein